LREVQPSDLLAARRADLRVDELRAEFEGARIVITGAAGSIGSELVRQLVKLEPAVIYLIDRTRTTSTSCARSWIVGSRRRRWWTSFRMCEISGG